jgi:hypothetical protein
MSGVGMGGVVGSRASMGGVGVSGVVGSRASSWANKQVSLVQSGKWVRRVWVG